MKTNFDNLIAEALAKNGQTIEGIKNKLQEVVEEVATFVENSGIGDNVEAATKFVADFIRKNMPKRSDGSIWEDKKPILEVFELVKAAGRMDQILVAESVVNNFQKGGFEAGVGREDPLCDFKKRYSEIHQQLEKLPKIKRIAAKLQKSSN